MFGIGSAFDAPTRQSFVGEIVGTGRPDQRGRPELRVLQRSRGMIGPALAGLLIAALGRVATGAVILVNAVSYGAVILSLQRMRESELHPSVPGAAAPAGMIREGIRYMRRRPDLMMILTIVFFAGTFGLNFQITSALMATEVFHKGAGEYGLLGTDARDRLAVRCAARRPARPDPAPAGDRRRPRSSGWPRSSAGLMPSYPAFAVVDCRGRARVADDDDLRERDHPDEHRPDDARPRDGALHDGVHGRDPDRAPIVGWVGQTFGPRWTLVGGGLATVLGTLLAVVVFSRARGLIGHREERPGRADVGAADGVVAGRA